MKVKKSYEVTEIEIPNTITKIGDYQFYGFNNVTKVVMSENIESIGSNAFASCDLLEKLYYEGTIEDWCNIVFTSYDQNPMNYADFFYMLNDNNEWYEVTQIEIPATVTKIGDYQFYGFKYLKEVIIPSSVTSIGQSVFVGCKSLTIYCKAESKPVEWPSNWNVSYATVYWANEWEYDSSGNPKPKK